MKKYIIPIMALVAISTTTILGQTQGIDRGAQTLNTLTGSLENYIDPFTKVMYIVAILIGLIGGIRVYAQWQAGKEGVMAAGAGWFGACLFLLIANTVLRGLFIE